MSGGAALGGCLSMILTITTSGGIGGFGSRQSIVVHVEQTPPALRSEVCLRLGPEALSGLDDVASPGAADYIIYHIMVEDEGAGRRVFDVPEPSLPPETLDLLDELMTRRDR